MADLCNIGTLSAFLIVCAGVLVLRRQEPDRQPGFRTPWMPWVPLLGIVACLWLMLGLPWTAWIRFGVWLVAGMVFFASYGFRHSQLARTA
jgi:APA family basic amino acid/polyamine antiporter